MQPHERHTGSWSGTNAFRLMPGDAPRDAPMTARVAPAARGGLTQVAYAWTHPEDGDQEGLLVVGPGDAPGSVVAFWGDSWHQQPEPRTLEGTAEAGVVTVAYAYAGEWRWEIVLDTTEPGALTLTMRNVVPASAASDSMAAGPYAAMAATLRRDG